MTIEVIPLGRMEYQAALELQNRLVNELLTGRGGEKLLLLEHEPVYTIGRTRDRSSLRNSMHLPHRVIETNRGGQATYHGPGQLVGYPILNLNRRGRDLHRYLRFLEEFLIEFCSFHGVQARRCLGLTGVWVKNRKIASIGVGVRKWISMHGFAINIYQSALSHFANIVPCGITNVEMTSLESEIGGGIKFQEILDSAGTLFQKLVSKEMALEDL